MTLTIGIDLAQARDRTALIVLESYRPELSLAEINANVTARDVRRGRVRMPRVPVHHEIRHIYRLPPGTSYPAQTNLIVQTADAFSLDSRPNLVVDATGVGRPVVDMLREQCPYSVKAVTISSGNEVTKSGRLDVAVPKADLVGCLEVALSTRRLHSVPDLPLAADLDKELRAFGYEFTAAGRPKYEGHGSHDDLVLALCLALWGAERGGNIGASFYEFMEKDIARRNADPLSAYYSDSWEAQR